MSGTGRSGKYERALRQERFTLAITEAVAERVNESKLERSTIAERAGMTKQELAAVLDGRNDLSVRQIADVAHALRMEPAITLRPQPARTV